MKKIKIKWEIVITIMISCAAVFVSYKAYEISKVQVHIVWREKKWIIHGL